jgi:hypothetical protein
METRLANILRVAVILMVLTVWLPTAAVLAVPHRNDWVEIYLDTAFVRNECVARDTKRRTRTGGIRRRASRPCLEWSPVSAGIAWDGLIVLGPINLALLAGLYFISGSLSLRPERSQETSDEASKD